MAPGLLIRKSRRRRPFKTFGVELKPLRAMLGRLTTMIVAFGM
jgi:hypothetical protein